MKIESPLPAHIAHEVAYFDDIALVAWAEKYLPRSEYFGEDVDLLELLSINKKSKREVEKAGVCLSVFISRQWPEFNIKGSKAEKYAKIFFHQRMQEYLNGECRPYDVCKMISPIEQLYDFPSWLGNMYNACDWVEPETEPADCRHLEGEIESALKL
ncbi:MAG: hypothetical protein GY928_30610 [Colwellia sp.]|nr:hypothetical protein [Colwellia sp.]